MIDYAPVAPELNDNDTGVKKWFLNFHLITITYLILSDTSLNIYFDTMSYGHRE